jgi:pyruvate formate lyase activating enzyme
MPIVCDVCPRACKLAEGQTGFCGTRMNLGEKNIDQFYQLVDYEAPSPRYAMMICFPSCNLRCPGCGWRFLSKRNADIRRFREISEDRLVYLAEMFGQTTLSFFLTEPTLHHEYLLRTAELWRARGHRTALSTNGYVNPWLAEKLAKAMDAVYVGIKGSASPELYRTKMGVDVSACLEATRVFHENNPCTLISNVVGPGFPPSESDDIAFARWLCTNVSPDIWVRLLILCESQSETRSFWDRLPPVEPWPEARTRIRGTMERLKSGGLTHVFPPEEVCLDA